MCSKVRGGGGPLAREKRREKERLGVVHDLVRKKSTNEVLAKIMAPWLETFDAPFNNSLW